MMPLVDKKLALLAKIKILARVIFFFVIQYLSSTLDIWPGT